MSGRLRLEGCKVAASAAADCLNCSAGVVGLISDAIDDDEEDARDGTG